MKKYLFIILFSFVLIGFILYNFTPNKEVVLNENSKEKIKPTGMNSLAIMLQNDKGEYVVSDADTWPASGYVFNDALSSCENGGKLSWNEDTKSITLKTSGSDKCYVYFDIVNYENIQLLINKANSMDETEKGILLQHNGNIKSEDGTVLDANDKGYRYSGNNPNNFICFGSGSEDYNNGESETCELTNQYRIIGIVPVTKADGIKENLVKVIKSEYINQTDLGLMTNDTSFLVDAEYAPNPRIKTTSGLHGFYWNDTDDNTWSR